MNIKDELSALKEEKIASEEIYDGAIMHITRDTVSLPDNNTAYREIMHHVGAVCVIPVDSDGNVILERQYRYAAGTVMTEIPAGKLDSPTEDRLSAAKRELREETGYTAESWHCLGDFYPAPAYSTERITMYLARELKRGERELDEDEFLTVFTMPLTELVAMVNEGKIPDAKTQLAALRAQQVINSSK